MLANAFDPSLAAALKRAAISLDKESARELDVRTNCLRRVDLDRQIRPGRSRRFGRLDAGLAGLYEVSREQGARDCSVWTTNASEEYAVKGLPQSRVVMERRIGSHLNNQHSG